LEDALSKIRPEQVDLRKASSPSSVAESNSSAGPRIKVEPDTEDLAREFDGLNVENDGRVSFHGPTSLFQLPSGVASDTASKSHYAQEIEGRKERLINSAWRERAFEQMAAMPVSVLVFDGRFMIVTDAHTTRFTGTVPVSSRFALVLDPTALEFRLPTCIYTSVFPRFEPLQIN
jgi:hypothetical protein